MTHLLAFDDGPLDTTDAILDTLLEYKVSATFFVVGELIAGHQELLERMVAEGHAVGNHGWTHTPHDQWSFDRVCASIAMTQDEITGACSIRPTVFRTPYVRRSDVISDAAAAMRVRLALETSLGDYAMEADDIVEIAALVPPGRTLWLHDGHWPTVEALPRILAHRAALEAVAA